MGLSIRIDRDIQVGAVLTSVAISNEYFHWGVVGIVGNIVSISSHYNDKVGESILGGGGIHIVVAIVVVVILG